MKNIPVILLSTGSVKRRFETRYSKAFHKQCKWIAVGPAQLNKKKIFAILNEAGYPPGNLVILLPEKNNLFYRLPPVLQNTVVSFVTYKQTTDLEPWFNSVKNYRQAEDRIVIASMQKPFYIKWAKNFFSAIKKNYGTSVRVLFRPPELATRKDLGKLFASGFRFCIYTGHGRDRGWSGYRGFRWEDIAGEEWSEISGSVLSLSCSAFNPQRINIPFAMQWIRSGRLNSFCGFCGAVHIQPLITISHFILDTIALQKKATVSSLVRSVNRQVLASENGAVIKEWQNFRIAGNPLMKIF